MSLNDILKDRQKSDFVGREDQLSQFQQNLNFHPKDNRRRFIFNVYGQGGVGKSTLCHEE